MTDSLPEVPLFPLGTVLFPGGLLPLRIFEQRYLEMAKACLRDGTPFGACLIREGAAVGEPAVHEDVGCLARIAHWDMEQLGLLQVVAQGDRRFRILSRGTQADGLVTASLDLLPEDSDAPVPEDSLCRKLLQRIASEHGEKLFAQPWNFESSAWVSSRLAEVLPLPTETKQKLLEIGDGAQRLAILQKLVSRSATPAA